MTETRKELAILSVYDKTGIVEFAEFLQNVVGLQLVATGGTGKLLKENSLDVTDISDLTGVSEMLNGRVKTLHPAVYAGILARNSAEHRNDLKKHNYSFVRVVVCNLYPFEETIAREGCTMAEAVEQIDIGGVTLLRAAAKNHERVTILSDPANYRQAIRVFQCKDHDAATKQRKQYALKAFEQTARYDDAIASYFQEENTTKDLELRYGMNPHQTPAMLSPATGSSNAPLTVLNGAPGYINLLDALNGWQLVKELSDELHLPAAASFKHVSPAGAAVAVPLSDAEAKAYMVDDLNLSPLAIAYARARGADRLSSFGDFISLSETVDVSTARLIAREVSDGCIAPGYDDEALEILRKKKSGKYCVLKIDKNYVPPAIEERTVFGLTLRQHRNDARVTKNLFNNIVSENKSLSESAIRDLVVATIALKYTQSNSVAYALNGQVIGVGAGQQSRIHCTKIAGEKAKNWWLRQHLRVLALPFVGGVKRPARDNAIDFMVTAGADDVEEDEVVQWQKNFTTNVTPLSKSEISEWMTKLTNVSFSSDAFIPFRDNVNCAKKYGVKYIASTGGSTNDHDIVKACDKHNIVLIYTGLRLFHH